MDICVMYHFGFGSSRNFLIAYITIDSFSHSCEVHVQSSRNLANLYGMLGPIQLTKTALNTILKMAICLKRTPV